ncbi:hypothetical protein, partial [Salmonella sp. s55004]|uniref:hypothetical protein n=1 Tax=Salmonella sp. s55004 TaxID=3159675 RepID=UPI00397FC4C8
EILKLPKTPILQDFTAADQHVIAISLGTFNATSFKEALKERSNIYSTVVTTVQLFIPFLSGMNEMEPIYKLSLGSFVSTDKPIIQPNPAIPTQQVDSLDVTINDMSLQHGQDTFKMSWSAPKQPCSPDNVIIRKLDAYIDEFTVSYKGEMNFSMCDKIDEDVDLCQNRDKIRCELSKNGFNSCQYWLPGKNVKR